MWRGLGGVGNGAADMVSGDGARTAIVGRLNGTRRKWQTGVCWILQRFIYVALINPQTAGPIVSKPSSVILHDRRNVGA